MCVLCIALQISRVQTEVMAVLEDRLAEVWNQTQSTYITEAIVIENVKTQIQQHLNSTKQQWMKVVSVVRVYVHVHYMVIIYILVYMFT